MQAEAAVAVVMRSFEAYARGDIQQAVACMHPDIEWIEPETFLNGGRRRGRPAMVRYFEESRSQWAEVISQPTPYHIGSSVVIVVHVTGRLVDGRKVDATVADVFSVTDGQITRMVAYADPAHAFAAVGAPGPRSPDPRSPGSDLAGKTR